ncbi:hypothetical protein CYLTODRAFT_421930 [Cylindrobasidium torrendii FP15055 ss-10]|uniref:Uncharacterized protein n=1 Tax=Cylindrobasidium torrendii FP15055 ss-10 TaxID=1314674 RepID=A0A0D7BEQ3_9AGAR|nr:hypothetical protein CYLTODRAFT_421930 [Cylindrobasidium torrendii FP15055 ss-10]
MNENTRITRLSFCCIDCRPKIDFGKTEAFDDWWSGRPRCAWLDPLFVIRHCVMSDDRCATFALLLFQVVSWPGRSGFGRVEAVDSLEGARAMKANQVHNGWNKELECYSPRLDWLGWWGLTNDVKETTVRG